MFSLALITGATSGIGEALAKLLAEKGIALILVGRNQSKLEKLQKELSSVTIVVADLANSAGRKKLVNLIRERKPDLIINNAGFILYGMASELSTEEQLNLIEVNDKAALELTLEGAKVLISESKPGVILNVASAAGLYVYPKMSVYAATKSFLIFVSQNLDYEFKPFGVRVLVSCPGKVQTELFSRATGKPYPEEFGVMTPEFAAKEIWKQICSRKPVHQFDWRYRVGYFFSKFLPKSVMAKWLMSVIEKR